ELKETIENLEKQLAELKKELEKKALLTTTSSSLSLHKNGSIIKSELELINLQDEDVKDYPWISTINIHEKIFSILREFGPQTYEYNDPLTSCIIDTSDPPFWLKDNFDDDTWDMVSSSHNSNFHSSTNKSSISQENMKQLKDHLKNEEYKNYNEASINEGTWSLDSVWISMKIACRDSGHLRLLIPEKINKGSKKRVLEEIDAKTYRLGKKSDITLLTTKLYINNHKKVPFELLIGEVIHHPWKKDQSKVNNDRRKSFRMLKDMYDLICKYFHKKYGTSECGNINLKNLELYSIIIKELDLYVYSLDQPGSRLYRVKLVDHAKIPVCEDNNNERYYELIKKIVASVNHFSALIEDLDKKLNELKTEKKSKINRLLVSKTFRSP
ncbi:5662_t:CDS:2, partial [Entrophospora sp. SA101]